MMRILVKRSVGNLSRVAEFEPSREELQETELTAPV